MTNAEWWSQPFYTSVGGYKLLLKVYANGNGSGAGTHLSLYVNLMKGEHDDKLSFPVNTTITVQLLNWVSDSHHTEVTIPHYTAPLDSRVRVTEGDRAPGGLGYGQYISHTELLDCSTLKYNINNDKCSFRIVCVDIVD